MSSIHMTLHTIILSSLWDIYVSANCLIFFIFLFFTDTDLKVTLNQEKQSSRESIFFKFGHQSGPLWPTYLSQKFGDI